MYTLQKLFERIHTLSLKPDSKVSNEPWKLKSRSKTVPRRPSSAKKLPPLPEDVVLTGAHASTLKQVTFSGQLPY